MSLRGLISPIISQHRTSKVARDRLRRKVEAARRGNGEPHRLVAFLRIDDPYSVLLAEALAEIVGLYDVVLDVELVDAEPPDFYPAPGQLAALARADARPIARRFGLNFAENPVDPTPEAVNAALAQIVAAEAPRRLEVFRQAAQALWRGGSTRASHEPAVAAALAAGNSRLQSLGHYLSGMIFYGNEWYWGVDRLDHLERRLIDLGASRTGAKTPRFDRAEKPAPGLAAGGLLTIFFSLRSPYSYIGFERALALAGRYGVPVDIRPVLPMLMRGLKVPPAKSRYILMDATREAEALGIPFGRIVDPLGKGVERTYALIEFARDQGKLLPYLASVLRAAWAEGIELAADRGLRKAVERVGLDWRAAKPLVASNAWRRWAEENQALLAANGLWGVPSFVYGEVKVWGQDRLWRIEEAMSENAR